MDSTVCMLKTDLDILLHVDAFSSRIHTEEVCTAFSNCSSVLQISHEPQQFLSENVYSTFFDPFDEPTEAALSSEKYVMWSLTLLLALRIIKKHLIRCEIVNTM